MKTAAIVRSRTRQPDLLQRNARHMRTQNNHNHLATAAGLVAVVGNLLGVYFLGNMPSAYRVARLDEWVGAVFAQPVATAASAISFTVGLIALAAWARWLGREQRTRAAAWGGALIATTALFNALGTTTPLVVAVHVGACGEACNAVARAMLGLTLTLDALFNLGLGVGLLLIAAGAVTAPRWLRALMQLAGLASLPVSAQALWDPAASVLYIAAPLWLVVIIASCFWQHLVTRQAVARCRCVTE